MATQSNTRFAGLDARDYLKYAQIVRPHYQEMHKVIEELYLGSSMNGYGKLSVLELGTGGGNTTEKLLKVGHSFVTSVDVEKGMIDLASSRLFPGNFNRLRLVKQDINSFLQNLESHTYMIVVSMATLHNIPIDQRSLAFQDIYRVLIRGGQFIIADKLVSDDKNVRKKEFALQQAALSGIDKLSVKDFWLEHNEIDHQTAMSEGEFEELMAEVGFSEISHKKRFPGESVYLLVK